MAKEIVEKYQLSREDCDRIVEMAWEDRTPFEAIKMQYGVTEAEVIRIMRAEMTLKNWQKWRARVQGRSTKHRNLSPKNVTRFKSKMQKASGNRISKKKY